MRNRLLGTRINADKDHKNILRKFKDFIPQSYQAGEPRRIMLVSVYSSGGFGRHGKEEEPTKESFAISGSIERESRDGLE
jgi:hypothetical protein